MAGRSDTTGKEKETRTESGVHEISVKSCRTKETEKEKEKVKLKPEIDGKHKEKNEKLLSKNRQSIVVAVNSTKLSSINPILSGKLALSRQKEVEIYDSHAIDFGQVRKSKLPDDVLDNAFLPRHLRKRVSKCRSKLSSTRSQIRPSCLESESEEGHFAEERVFLGESSQGACDGGRTLSTVSEYERRTNSCFFGLDRERRQHDTLDAFGKCRMEKQDRDKRLRKIKAEARMVDNKTNEPIVKSLAYRKQLSLPALDESYQTQAQGIKTAYTRKRERCKLPRLKNIHNGDTRKESRFDKLLSSLVPAQDKRHTDWPRRRHFTL